MKKLLLSAVMIVSASVASAWTPQTEENSFEGTSRTVIISNTVQPNSPLGFPYNNPLIYLYWDCDLNSFVMRNTANNLNGGRPSSYGDFSTFSIDIKVDGTIKRNVRVTQRWGSDFITIEPEQQFNDTSYSIFNARREIVIQLDHYGSGLRTYTFNLQSLDKGACGENLTTPERMNIDNNIENAPADAYVQIVNTSNGEVVYWDKAKWDQLGSVFVGLENIKITFLN